MKALKEKLKKHSGAFLVLGIFAGCTFIGVLIFMLFSSYMDLTHEESASYDKNLEIKKYSEPKGFAEVEALDPELCSMKTVKNTYLLYEYLSLEDVDLVKKELDGLYSFYTEILYSDDKEVLYDENFDKVLRYMGDMPVSAFKTVTEHLNKAEVNLVIQDSIRKLSGAGLLVFKIADEDEKMLIECVFSEKERTFVAELVKFDEEVETWKQ